MPRFQAEVAPARGHHADELFFHRCTCYLRSTSGNPTGWVVEEGVAPRKSLALVASNSSPMSWTTFECGGDHRLTLPGRPRSGDGRAPGSHAFQVGAVRVEAQTRVDALRRRVGLGYVEHDR